MKINVRRRTALIALKTWDAAVFLACLLAAIHLDDAGALEDLRRVPLLLCTWLGAAGFAAHLALSYAHAYRSRRLSRAALGSDIVFGVSLATGCAAALAILTGIHELTLTGLVMGWGFATTAILASRLLLDRGLTTLREHGRNLRSALIIGGGRRALKLLERLDTPEAGYALIGYVDDGEQGSAGAPRRLGFLGSLDELPKILAQNVVDEVFVALPMRSRYDRIARALADCKCQGISVKIPLDLCDAAFGADVVDSLEGTPVLCYAPAPASALYLASKRALDVGLSASALLLLAPLFLLVGMLIKLESPGPVFFVQRRVGLNKRLFPLVKFRTMRVGSEKAIGELEQLNEADGPVFKIKNDPRVTRLGHVLRRTSIDELPQFVNVLAGQLSLVGPRPLPVRDVQGFSVDAQRRRFSVKPGITCTWQVSGRSALPFERWMELDMQYIEQRSLLLDLQILAKTVHAVLSQRGAH